MITEAGELMDGYKRRLVYGSPLDIINIKEEVGDCLWYANLFAVTAGMPMRLFCADDVGSPELPASEFARLTGLCGTAAAVGCALSLWQSDPETQGHQAVDMREMWCCYMFSLLLIAQSHGFTLEEAAAINIAKLQTRYPDGFTSGDAVNRDTSAERAVMEEAAQ
jgi:NTP pyrophosphatase (non-canonical NTP hydrolase)